MAVRARRRRAGAHLFVAGDSVGANIAHKSGTSTFYFIEKSGSGGGEKEMAAVVSFIKRQG